MIAVQRIACPKNLVNAFLGIYRDQITPRERDHNRQLIATTLCRQSIPCQDARAAGSGCRTGLDRRDSGHMSSGGCLRIAGGPASSSRRQVLRRNHRSLGGQTDAICEAGAASGMASFESCPARIVHFGEEISCMRNGFYCNYVPKCRFGSAFKEMIAKLQPSIDLS